MLIEMVQILESGLWNGLWAFQSVDLLAHSWRQRRPIYGVETVPPPREPVRAKRHADQRAWTICEQALFEVKTSSRLTATPTAITTPTTGQSGNFASSHAPACAGWRAGVKFSSHMDSPFIREARLQEPTDDGHKVRCLTCERRCELADGQAGWCRTRQNQGGTLYTLIYGAASSLSCNPIEKKPLYHFYPGSVALTAGSWSCNFGWL
jgi:hypothetical protein